MHEMSLCLGIMDLIEQQRRQQGFKQVTRVIVDLGMLGHVDPHALEFAFAAAAKDTAADSAILQINEIPGRGLCVDCRDKVVINMRGDACPGCGGYNLVLEQGEELKLKELEVL
jgi:hydrogenase nickel incorporation protein HypA/HybF